MVISFMFTLKKYWDNFQDIKVVMGLEIMDNNARSKVEANSLGINIA